MSLPLYRLVINEDDHTGVTAVALVDRPAIELNWQAFNNQKRKFETVSAEKRIIAGPLMLANTPIYRSDERGEYDVVFYPEDIENIVDKYHRKQYSQNVNPMHESMLLLPDIYMISNFIVDSTKGFSSPMGYQLPDGSWFGMFKVRNEEVWNEYIKTGVFKGFSVEGFFNEVLVSESLTDQEVQGVLDAVS
jgi:hypothetical protein